MIPYSGRIIYKKIIGFFEFVFDFPAPQAANVMITDERRRKQACVRRKQAKSKRRGRKTTDERRRKQACVRRKQAKSRRRGRKTTDERRREQACVRRKQAKSRRRGRKTTDERRREQACVRKKEAKTKRRARKAFPPSVHRVNQVTAEKRSSQICFLMLR